MDDAGSRIGYFERMLADNPDNPTGLLALANEYGKAGRHEDEAAVLRKYTEVSEDEGNAYLRLGEVLVRLGCGEEARTAYETGVRQAEKHGHDGMAEDLRIALMGLNER
ncbi:MAG: tetratricopeptide repeat protein [Rubrobacteraceae bacterium]